MNTTTCPTTTSTFEVGNTYNTGNGDYVWTFRVISRTAKFMQIEDVQNGDVRRVGISVSTWDNEEIALPLGRYSMAPVICAGRVA